MMFLNPLEYVKRTFPFLQWMKEYDADKAISDVIAGITVGLTLIPQSIAYASLAGLDPQVKILKHVYLISLIHPPVMYFW